MVVVVAARLAESRDGKAPLGEQRRSSLYTSCLQDCATSESEHFGESVRRNGSRFEELRLDKDVPWLTPPPMQSSQSSARLAFAYNVASLLELFFTATLS